METTMMEVSCPFCGQVLDRHKGHGAPAHGDCSFCVSCGGLSIYVVSSDGDAELRKPSTDEQRELDVDPRVTQLTRAWLEMQDGRRS